MSFVASNGLTVVDHADGFGIRVHGTDLTELEAAAIREYFLHEADEQRGCWRWPGDPAFVVYPPDDEGRYRVLQEPTGRVLFTRKLEGVDAGWERHNEALGAYLAAHPKPWHNAQPDEIWVLTTCDGMAPSGAWQAVDTIEAGIVFKPLADRRNSPTIVSHIGRSAPVIVVGHRIWPEDAT